MLLVFCSGIVKCSKIRSERPGLREVTTADEAGSTASPASPAGGARPNSSTSENSAPGGGAVQKKPSRWGLGARLLKQLAGIVIYAAFSVEDMFSTYEN